MVVETSQQHSYVWIEFPFKNQKSCLKFSKLLYGAVLYDGQLAQVLFLQIARR